MDIATYMIAPLACWACPRAGCSSSSSEDRRSGRIGQACAVLSPFATDRWWWCAATEVTVNIRIHQSYDSEEEWHAERIFTLDSAGQQLLEVTRP